ncbi:ester cyclase [Streptomyces sp. TRM49041]|uniref:ester cyclase n=1 Tax=Streptomyces sp. TRM49041 TaxID=2603216 RepID=UPI0011EC97E2|nr:ester cyclase [Streptomyces sp. TRM49041]
MTFVQVIDCRTQQADALNKLMDNWVEATRGKRTATHSIVAKDRSDSAHVVEIVEFPSYEEAMRNSNLPETDRIYQQMVELCDGEPSFTDLDVIRDEQLNKALARDFLETMVNRGDLEAAYQLCTADYREHDPSLSSYDLSVDEVKPENKEILDAFQPQMTLHSLIAEGDEVCVRFSFRGRHVAAYQGLEATGRDVAGTGHATFRCSGGRLAESWWNVDDLGLMKQLGAVEA